MTKAQAIISNAVTNGSKRSSIISKCVAPFAAKQRSPIEQDIRLDEPFRQYAPGDQIKGAIHLTVIKPIRITHLAVRLHGLVKVSNRAKVPGESISYDESLSTSSNGIGRRGTEYFGNGFARIFEDEAILCGEGRLHGQYQFRFETSLPFKSIPSSIDFEHGTIAYFVTSTITRPTTIAPTSTQHFKLHVQETIDIAAIKRPEPVLIWIEATYKKGKQKASYERKTMQMESRRFSKSSSRDSTNGMPIPQSITNVNVEEPPRSPVSSEVSSTTATTSSTSSNVLCSQDSPSCTANSVATDSIAIPDTVKVYARTEILHGAALPGDILPIRIFIKHKQPVKNMQGIVVTLYRQGRIDTHPAIPIGPVRKGEKKRYEDYYPRSRTGLSGLSLTSAGSSRSFRQDLNQIFVPLILNPRSLTAIVNTSIQVPPDCFPSITAVPGAMVNFKYYVEVVVDLRAKLSSQDKIRPHLSMTSTPQHGYGDPKVSRCEGSDGISYLSTPGFNYLITDQLRRTRGVATTRTEIVVGTRDSARKRSKKLENRASSTGGKSIKDSIDLGREVNPDEVDLEDQTHGINAGESTEQRQTLASSSAFDRPTIPLPEPEEILDEKGQMRRAEQRLLPGAPSPDHSRLSLAAPIPTAPAALDDEDFVESYGTGPAPAYDGPSAAAPEQNSLSFQDDKQEHERQRLQALASSPEIGDSEAEAVDDDPQMRMPSAPTLHEDDIFDIDPRIPDSSPIEFADEQVVQEMPLQHVESPAALQEEEVSHRFTNDERAHLSIERV